ncbi:MAG: hypothetical protein WBQ68_03470 [Terriglobales bacterium]
MSMATTAIVSSLVAASVFAFFRWFSAASAGSGAVSALFPVLSLVIAMAGVVRWRGGRGKRWLLRWAAPALLVPLGCGVSWASFSLTFQGLVQPLNTGGSITLTAPSGVVVDAAGNVFIVDTGNSRIVEVNAQGVASVLAITGLSPALSGPSGIAIDQSGNLFVADTGNNRVVEITAAGIGSAISTGSVTLGSPKGVALDQSGNIFIADTGNNRIVEVSAGGSAAALAIAVSSGSPTLATPLGLAVDVSGKLYIADSVHNRIVTVAAGSGTGVVASILGGVVLSGPTAVAVDRIGNVFIADTGHSRIAEIDTSANGTVLFTGSTTLTAPLGVAVDVFGTVYIADTGNNRGVVVDPPVNADLGAGDSTYSLNKTVVGFGHIQLGSATAVTLTLPFTTGGSGGLGGVKVLTSGVQGLDFISGVSTTCTGTTGASTFCTVQVSFLPTEPGLRRGSVVLLDDEDNPILSVPLYGWGDSPLAALSPNTGTVIDAGGLTLANPYQVALDGAGNIYVGDYSGKNVTRIAAGGGSAAVVPLGTPGSIAVQNITGVAVDGAGNLFIADHQNSRILVVTPGGVVSVLSIIGLSPVLGFPTALAFDAAGNLYIADFTLGRMIRVSTLVVAGSTSSGLGVVIGTGTFSFGGSTLTGMTVDTEGNVYAAARTQNSSNIIKVTTAGVASVLNFPGLTPAISNPQGVAADAMGNIYVADTANLRIVRLTTAGVASAVSNIGLPAPSTLSNLLFGVTSDPSGNLLIPDWSNNRIVAVNVGSASLTFPSTDVGSASSPQIATVTNIGNLPLAFSTNPAYTANFSKDNQDENLCAMSAALAPGILCDVAVEFTPQSAGSLSAAIVVTDNHRNLTATTQNVAVSGTGIAVADSTAVAVSTLPTSVVLGQSISITAIVTDTAEGRAATIPTGGVTFMDTVGATTISLNGGSAVALNGSGRAILAGVTLAGEGVHTITANYAGVPGAFLASSQTTTISAGSVTVTTTFTITAPTTPFEVAPGGVATIPITVPPLGGAFDNVVTLSASGLPPGATASFNPAAVTPGSAGAATVLTIRLATLAAGSVPANHIPANRRGIPVAWFSLGFVLFGALLGRKRIPKVLGLVLALASLGVSTSLLTGCNGGFSSRPSTPAGRYTVTVTGTSGLLKASTTVTLVVE